MAITNQRFVTTWTSEDAIQWRMYILPSSANYIAGGSTNVTLPSEFLMRDMSLDTELGPIPAGIVSQVLKINVNIASLQGSTALNDLRTELLRGTMGQKAPINSDGSTYLGHVLTTQQLAFDSFNTFILQYNDGSGWKVAFIGCQKYSAENELEVTALDNVITFSIEIYDIFRCIGEAISQDVWVAALKPTTDTVAWNSSFSTGEGTALSSMEIGQYTNLDQSDGTIYAVDSLQGTSYFHVQLFSRLTAKISTMYSAYMRTILGKLTASFVAADFYSKTIIFYKNQTQDQIYPYLQYVSEIWARVEGGLQLVGGAHVDAKMFGQYTNFYEVYKNLVEGSLETLRPSYTFTAGSPDSYTLTMQADNPYPFDYQVTFDQDSTYSGLKIKLFSEALNQVNVAVSTITGDRDTTEFEYGKQGTSGDNSKDLKIMFHNLPIITFRNRYFLNRWIRNTINAGTLVYWESPETGIYDLKKVNTLCSIFFSGEDFALTVPASPYVRKPDYQMILEQQQSGLPQTIAQGLVNFLGRSKQAEATLTSTFTFAKGTLVSKRCIIDLLDYNPLLEAIYDANEAYCVMTKHSHKIYEGMCDITLRIDAELE